MSTSPSLEPSGRPRQREAGPVIIDTDPGIDDLVALALALRSRSPEILAVTTTYGNAPLATVTRNAEHLLRLAQRSEIPVHPGAGKPLSRPATSAPEMHGDSGIGYAAANLPTPARVAPNEHVISELLADCPEPITLVTLGPLTNLAHALRDDRRLVSRRIKRHIGMFGCLRRRRSPHRWADFNAWSDPEAAELVVSAQIPTYMVGLDVTRLIIIRAHEVQTLASSSDPLSQWLGDALRFYVMAHRTRSGLEGCYVHDALAIGELLRPGLLRFADEGIEVDLDDGERRGHTRVSTRGDRLHVAVAVDSGLLRSLLDSVLRAQENSLPDKRGQ
ncbi:MAG: nucleoside hydrolase [Gemmatimonadota bacterium]|nr:MAG: nucleoside hydrolase [Gemmatimonadota bacterium]